LPSVFMRMPRVSSLGNFEGYRGPAQRCYLPLE
jgi:hypothetical protein